jgi:hypothetical protein
VGRPSEEKPLYPAVDVYDTGGPSVLNEFRAELTD